VTHCSERAAIKVLHKAVPNIRRKKQINYICIHLTPKNI